MKNNRLSDSSCTKRMFTLFFLCFWGVCFLFWSGCTKPEVTRAFDGEFDKVKNNELINSYCTSCHNHKKFDSEQHVLEIRQKYRRKFFRRTSECRVCHYIEKTWMSSHSSRKTRRPKEVNKGSFRELERKRPKVPR